MRVFFRFLAVLCSLDSVLVEQNPCVNGFALQQGICVQTNNVTCSMGYVAVEGVCVQAQCPPTHVWANGLCYWNTNGGTNCNGACHSGCGMAMCNNMNCQNACVGFVVNVECRSCCSCGSMSSALQPPALSTTPAPAPTPTTCPPGTVMIDGTCHLIYCSYGTMVNGKCVRIECTNGTVWTGSGCEKPAIVTTILELTNEFHFNVTQSVGDVMANSTNTIYVHDEDTNQKKETTTIAPMNTTTEGQSARCCVIISPRMCKRYSTRWVCYHRRYKRCATVCDTPIVYIKPPTILVHAEITVVPPQISLSCTSAKCTNSSSIDCSGCAKRYQESCSSYCYQYACPGNGCSYIDQQYYCRELPGSEGCFYNDGCFDEWCSKGVQNVEPVSVK